MEGTIWLDEIALRVTERFGLVEISRPDGNTLSLMYAQRLVVLHATGTQALLAPSISTGSTIESRLRDRVCHLDIQQYGIAEATVDVAVDAVLSHLRIAS